MHYYHVKNLHLVGKTLDPTSSSTSLELNLALLCDQPLLDFD